MKRMKLRNMTAIYILKGDQILMLYRQGGKVVNNVYVGTAGGHFEPEEVNDPKACVLRELKEECGLEPEEIKNLTMRYATKRLKDGEIRQNYYYFASLKDDVDILLDSNEGRLQWVPFSQVMEKDMPLTAKFMLEHYLTIGRFDEDLYSGVTTEDHMVFTKLEEF